MAGGGSAGSGEGGEFGAGVTTMTILGLVNPVTGTPNMAEAAVVLAKVLSTTPAVVVATALLAINMVAETTTLPGVSSSRMALALTLSSAASCCV